MAERSQWQWIGEEFFETGDKPKFRDMFPNLRRMLQQTPAGTPMDPEVAGLFAEAASEIGRSIAPEQVLEAHRIYLERQKSEDLATRDIARQAWERQRETKLGGNLPSIGVDLSPTPTRGLGTPASEILGGIPMPAATQKAFITPQVEETLHLQRQFPGASPRDIEDYKRGLAGPGYQRPVPLQPTQINQRIGAIATPLQTAPAPTLAPVPAGPPPASGGPPQNPYTSFVQAGMEQGPRGTPSTLAKYQTAEYSTARALGLQWGWSSEQTVQFLAGAPNVLSPSQAEGYIAVIAREKYGTYNPSVKGEENQPLSRAQWAATPEFQRRRLEQAVRPEEGKGRPETWEPGFYSRQGTKALYTTEQLAAGAWWPAGEEPGSVRLPASMVTPGPGGVSKLAKRAQQLGTREQVEVYGPGGRSLQFEAPWLMGPGSQVKEQLTRVRAEVPLYEPLVSGQGLVRAGEFTDLVNRTSKTVKVPEGFEPQGIPAVGTVFNLAAGEQIVPFKGAEPLQLRSWEKATVTGIERLSETEMVYGIARSEPPEKGGFSIKYGATKLGGAVATQEAFDRLVQGRDIGAVLPAKSDLWIGIAMQTAAAMPQELVAEYLNKVEGGKQWTAEALRASKYQVFEEQWLESFRKEVLPQFTKPQPYTFNMTAQELAAIPEDDPRRKMITGQKELGEGRIEVTANIPTYTPPFGLGTQVSREYPGRQPFIPRRELERMGRLSPEGTELIERYNAPIHQALGGLLGAQYATETGKEMPGAVVPTAAQALGIVQGAMSQAQEELGTTAGVPPEQLTGRILQQEAEVFGTSPLNLGQGRMAMAPALLQRFLTRGVMEGEEASGLGRARARMIQGLALGSEQPKEKERLIQEYMAAQSLVAAGQPGSEQSSEAVRKFIGAALPPRRTVSGQLQTETGMPANTAYVPQEKVLEMFGLKKGSRRAEAFLERWERRNIDPSMRVWGYPTGGEKGMALNARLISEKERQELGLKLSPSSQMILSTALTQAMQRDDDSDIAIGLATGRAVGRSSNLGIVGGGRISTVEDVEKMAALAQRMGAAQLMPREFLSGKSMEEIQAGLDPATFVTQNAGQLTGQFAKFEKLRQEIGPAYNLLEKLEVMARKAGAGEGAVSSSELLFGMTYGVMQRPEQLPIDLRTITDIMGGGKSWTGGFYSKVGEGGPGGVGGRGLASLFGGALRTAIEGKSLEPGEIANLFGQYQQTSEEQQSLTKMVETARQQNVMGQRGSLTKTITQMTGQILGPELDIGKMLTTPVGAVLGPRAVESARKYVEKGLPENPTDKQLREMAEAKIYANVPEAVRPQLEAMTKYLGGRSAALGRYIGEGETPGQTLVSRIKGIQESMPEALAGTPLQNMVGQPTPAAATVAPTANAPTLEASIHQIFEQMGQTEAGAAQRVFGQIPQGAIGSPQYKEWATSQPWSEHFAGTVPAGTATAGAMATQPTSMARPSGGPQAVDLERYRQAFGHLEPGLRPDLARPEDWFPWEQEAVGYTPQAGGKGGGGGKPPYIGATGLVPAAAQEPARRRTEGGGGAFPEDVRQALITTARAVQAERWISPQRFETALETIPQGLAQLQAEAGEDIAAGRPLSSAARGHVAAIASQQYVLERGMKQSGYEKLSETTRIAAASLTGGVEGPNQGISALYQQIPGLMQEMDRERTLRKMGVAPEKTAEGADKTSKAFENLTTRIEMASKALEPFTKAVEEGKDLTKQQVAAQKWLSQQIATAAKAAEPLGALTPGQQVMVAGGQVAGQQAWEQQLQQRIGGPGGMGGGGGGGGFLPESLGAAAGGLTQNLTSWFGLMRIRRMWDLTGGYAMGQIPAAAREEQAYMGVVSAGVPAAQYGMAPTARDIMGYQAAQRGFGADVGRAAYGAWGRGLGLASQGGGIATGIGIAGPAVGAGLVGAQLAAFAGMGGGKLEGTLGPIGLPVAAIGTMMGTGSWMQQQGLEPGRYQANLAQQNWASPLGFMQAGFAGQIPGQPGDRGWVANVASAMAQVPRAIFNQDYRRQLQTWFQSSEQMGQAINQGNLANVPIEMQPVAVQGWAERATRPGQPLYFAGREGAAGMQTQFRQYGWGGADLEANARDARFRELLIRQETPQQYGQLAGQWGMLPTTGGQRMYDITRQMPDQQRMEWQASQQYLSGLGRQGVTPEQVRGITIQNMQQANFAQSLGQGAGWAWSQAGRQMGVAGWQTENQQGMQIGTNWGGQILGGRLGQTGWAGQQVQMAGAGNVMLGGQQVGFNQWGIQDFAMQQQQAQQNWQLQQQQRQMQMGRGYQLDTRAIQGGAYIPGTMAGEQYQYQMGQFGFQQRGMEQGNRQFMERWSMGWQQNQQQQAWQGTDMTRERQRQQVQFGWQEQDLAYQGARTSLQFGWQMEDFQREQRFATGRQRRDIMRQRERATVSYGMEMGQLETQEGRLKTREDWAEEDFNREKGRFEQRKTWSEQEMLLQLKHHNEDVKLQTDQFTATVEHFKTVTGYEEKLRVLQVKYQDDQYKMQAAELEHQKKYITVQQQIDEAQTALGRAQQLQLSEFRAQFEQGGLLKGATDAFVAALAAAFKTDGAIGGPVLGLFQAVAEASTEARTQIIDGVVGGGRNYR